MATRKMPDDRYARVLIVVAVVATTAFFALLLVVFRVPWGGHIDLGAAGPVAAWTGDLLTGLGILGLIYQISHLRRERADETTREINSLLTRVEHQEWERGANIPGTLYRVFIRNDGDRKAMRVHVDLQLASDRTPTSWRIGNDDGHTLGPRMDSDFEIAAFHIPRRAELGISKSPTVVVTWIDAWARSVRMIDNGPASVVIE